MYNITVEFLVVSTANGTSAEAKEVSENFDYEVELDFIPRVGEWFTYICNDGKEFGGEIIYVSHIYEESGGHCSIHMTVECNEEDVVK